MRCPSFYFFLRDVAAGIVGVFIDRCGAVSIGFLCPYDLTIVIVGIDAYFTVSVGDGADVAPVVVGVAVG